MSGARRLPAIWVRTTTVQETVLKGTRQDLTERSGELIRVTISPRFFRFDRLAVRFGIRIKKVVQWLACLGRFQCDVAAGGERDPIAGVTTEEKFFSVRKSAGF